MAVMNYAAFSAAQQLDHKDAVAVRNAFLKYSLQEQAELLVKMPISEALAMLHECPLRHVQLLLDRLDEMNEELRMRQLANGLGLICSEAEPTGNYLQNSVFSHVRERIGWIVGLALLGIVSGLIISHYEDTLSQLVLLAIYMPVIAAAGGNTGSQAATLVVRALAMDEIKCRDWVAVLWKEFRIAAVIAVALALVIVARVMFFSGHQVLPAGLTLFDVAGAIGVALAIQVTLSTSVGGVLPIIARACNLDPAVLVSPVLASMVDISGMIIYFTTVNKMLGLGG
ncbi:TPA: magnesium transporter [Photobacterium damselae]|uniref:Magnesium transporter n=2 Tax=Photobacterium damselae TaxID=38293 RepID=A0A1X9TY98_PHODD|nr:magnesium transporter [Photobacterium damselae]ARR48464.1 Mg2+ transporter mgtE [Photobacterium damselae subsp. damselae]AWK82716.1 Mg2+ transporter mgtE [Photobacterium damselae]EHA1081294.1 magnesium transporter [Photobacterium damselae]ELI6447709.1 magnesium transporter [Photobacterium damselae]KAB1180988.1 magnesium transporter [Photobacterium damselae subsp. damselae]